VPTRAATAAALATGDIDVGLLDSTDGRLGDGRLRLLVDDRGLQPRDNVVPVVRTDLVTRHGAALTGPIDALTARLSTAGVIELNHTMAVDPAAPAELAARYLDTLVP
jgi:osmoprotectant transport system substrate-binding protein